MKLKLKDEEISKDTYIGIIKNEFKNEKEIEENFKNKIVLRNSML